MGMESPENAPWLMTPTATANALVVVGICLTPTLAHRSVEDTMRGFCDVLLRCGILGVIVVLWHKRSRSADVPMMAKQVRKR